MKINKIFQILTSVLLLTSCATIVNGPTQQVGFTSVPSCATVLVNGHVIGRTPVSCSLKRNETHWVRIELEGFQPYEVCLSQRISGWVFGNILIGGPIGFVIDAVTGSIYKLTPDQVNAHMTQSTCKSWSKGHECFVSVVMEPESSWEKVGQLQRN